jgi:hypothetical protein
MCCDLIVRTREVLRPNCEDKEKCCDRIVRTKRSGVTELWGQENCYDRTVRTGEVLWPNCEDRRSATTELWGQEKCYDRTVRTRELLLPNCEDKKSAVTDHCETLQGTYYSVRCRFKPHEPPFHFCITLIFWSEIVWDLFSITLALAVTQKWRIILFRFYVSIRLCLLQGEIAWAFSVECKLIIFKMCIGNCRNEALDTPTLKLTFHYVGGAFGPTEEPSGTLSVWSSILIQIVYINSVATS